MKHTHTAIIALALLVQQAQPGRAQAAEVTATTATRAEVATAAVPTDPHGEWYAVGHRMAQESLPSFRLLAVPERELSEHFSYVLAALGVEDDSLKNTELTHLQKGWDDGIAGRSPAMTYPPEQTHSLLPPTLRGFHQFKRKKGEELGSLADKAAEWKKAVVKVIAYNDKGEGGHGTGFFISTEYIVTNHHVVDGCTKFAVQLEADESLHPATLVAEQAVPDVAILRVEVQDHETLPIGISDNCRELEEIIMIGYPRFIEYSATYVKGAISSTNRIVNECEVMQLDIRANQGNSGGPIITTDGRVVGLLTFGSTDATFAQFTYAIKIDTILPFLEKHVPGHYRRDAE